MKKLAVSLIFVFCITALCFAEEKVLLLDDFEGVISGGQDGTVDFGAGGGSSIEVTADTSIKHLGEQSLKIIYDALEGGYMWTARGFDLDARNTDWLVRPEDINWQGYNATSFYMYGSDSKTKIAFDIKDGGNEMWRYIIEDNFSGWERIVCPFNEFFAREDWQPQNADKNANLDFPIKSFQFEPLPQAGGVVYFDEVSLISQ